MSFLLKRSSLLVLFSLTTHHLAVAQAESPFTALAEQRLQCFDQPTKAEVKPEEVKKKKLDLNIRTLDAHSKHKELFRLLSLTDSKASNVLNKNSWRDLEIALGDHNAIANLHHVVDCTQTSFGSDYLLYKLTHPIDSPEQLIFQQNSVKELLANELLFKQLDTIFAAVAKSENNFFFMYQEESPFNKKTISNFYFTSTWPLLKHLRGLNSRSEYLQTVSLLHKIPSLALITWYPIAQWGIHNFSSGFNTITKNKDVSNGEISKNFPATKAHLQEVLLKDKNIDFTWNDLPEMYISLIEKLHPDAYISPSDREKIKIELAESFEELAEAYPNAKYFIEELLRSNEQNTTQAKPTGSISKEVITFAFKNHGKEATKETLLSLKRSHTPTSLGALTRLMIGGGSIYMGVNRERTYNNLTNYLHAQLISVATIIRAMNACSTLIEQNKKLADGLEHKEDLRVLFDTTSKKVSPKLHKLVALLLTNTFKGQASYFSLKGRVLAAYSLMQDVKDELAPALRALGEVETILSTAKLYKKFESKKVQFTFPTYLNANAPTISMSGMWNPFVATDKVVENSITLGNTMPQNVILTGPNAGGKSTFLKGTCLSILLAQTLGIAPVKELAFTPFSKINTYMNITDDTAGGNSLFKSEVLRAQGLLESVKNLNSKNFSFSIMDEMFSGTSPKEGAAASYAVAKGLGEINNSILLLATHFPLLTELETETKDFKNYQVRVVRHDNGGFSYPFKLEEGIANQNVAMDILQQQGFNASILKDATAILNR